MALPLFTSPFQIPGIELTDELGSGAESLVFRGIKSGVSVAVKIRKNTGGEPRALQLALRREAAALACISSLGLVQILEVGVTGDTTYIVMELVEGTRLDRLLENAFTPERVLEVAKVLALALSEVHRHGLVHRDIKPANIVIQNKDQIPKIIDFGFATNVQENCEGKVVGTILYSAPEQTGMIKRTVDGRSDLYSLGITLYECATGVPPFRSGDVGELMRQHAVVQAPDPRTLQPTLSPALSEIILKLIAKDPDDRYQTALSLLSDLENLARLDAAISGGSAPILGRVANQADLAYDSPLFGRASEKAQLDTVLAKALEKNCHAVLVEGGGGSGKSRLIRSLIDEVEQKGLLLLRGKCSAQEAAPFSLIRQWIDHYISTQSSAEGVEVLKRRILELGADRLSVVRHLSTQLQALLGSEGSGILGNTMGSDQFYEAIADFLLTLTQGHPGTVFLLDDVQWLDSGSLQVLRSLSFELGQSGKYPILLACTSRDDEANLIGLNGFVTAIQAMPLTRVKLEPLGEGAVSELLSYHLGGRRLPTEAETQILRMSLGSPFAAGEYIRAMLESGCLEPGPGSWVVDADIFSRLNLPTDVILLVLRRIEGLTRETRSAMDLAAIAGSRFDLDFLSEIDPETALTLPGAIAEAVGAHLLERAQDGGYRFVHDRVREAFLEDLTEAEGKQVHLRIADILEARSRARHLGPEDLYALVRHISKATLNSEIAPRILHWSVQGAKYALSEFAPEEAFRFLSFSDEVAKNFNLATPVEHDELLGEVLFRLAKRDEAIEQFGVALGKCQDPLRRGKLRERRAAVMLTLMRCDAAWQEVLLGMKELGSVVPKSRLGWVLSSLGYFIASQLLSRFKFLSGKKSPEALDLYKVLCDLNSMSGELSYYRNDVFQAVCIGLRCPYYAVRVGPSEQMVYAYRMYAALMASLGFKNAGQNYLDEASRAAELLGDPSLIASHLAYKSVILTLRGKILEAEQVALTQLPALSRWMPNKEYIDIAGDLSWGQMMRGLHQEHLEQYRRTLARFQRHAGGAEHFKEHHAFPGMAASQYIVGDSSKGLENIAAFRTICDKTPREIFRRSGLTSCELYVQRERDDYGPNADRAIEEHDGLGLSPLLAPMHNRVFFVMAAYTRLEQLMRATKEELPRRLKDAKKAVRDLALCANRPVFKAHYHVARAMLDRITTRSARAFRALKRAEVFARETDNDWVFFEIHRERARLYETAGDRKMALREAQIACQISEQHSWVHRAAQVRAEFKMAATSVSSRTSVRSGTGGSSVHSFKDVLYLRHRDTLLHMSLALSRELDPGDQARIALKEIVRLLTAERGFLFLMNEDAELEFQFGLDSEGQPLEDRNFSRTTVEKVRQAKTAVILSGTEAGEAMGTESMVVHNLRSILAAPLMMRETLIGVVYLDSRVVRGAFTPEDVEILTALSNHIAVAMETAKTAKLELQRQALEKDLEAKKAVQLILDNLNQGFMTMDQNGRIQSEISRAAPILFSRDPRGVVFSELLSREGRGSDKTLDPWVKELFRGVMDFEDLKALGPTFFENEQGLYVELDYRPIYREADVLDRIIVIATDKTDEQALRRKAEEERGRVQMVLSIVADRSGFHRLVRDARGFLSEFANEIDQAQGTGQVDSWLRTIHTLKGGAAFFYLHPVVRTAHELESRLAELKEGKGEALSETVKRELLDGGAIISAELEQVLSTYKGLIGDIRPEGIRERSFALSSLQSTARRLADLVGPDSEAVREFTKDYLLEDAAPFFLRYESMMKELGTELGKIVELKVDTGNCRILVAPYEALFSSLIHIFRNAMDHGFETREERLLQEKSEKGTFAVTLSPHKNGRGLLLRFEDDGRGINPELIRVALVKKGLRSTDQVVHLSDSEVIQLIFLPGFSSRDEVTAISGRGVGLDVVAQEVHELGGQVRVESQMGKGTVFVLELPWVRSVGPAVAGRDADLAA